MGPYDGNPFNLHRLPPVASGQRYVAAMGGIEAVLEQARDAVQAGDFRWAVQLLGHAVFAHPEREDARALAAEAMEQLGYQAESATWRNAYLLGASELRHGVLPIAGKANRIAPDVVACLPVDRILDDLAIRVRGLDAAALTLRIDWIVTDKGTCHRLTLSNGALSHRPGSHGDAAELVVRASRAALAQVQRPDVPPAQALAATDIAVEGDTARWEQFLACLDRFDTAFGIVVP
jgi:alkyl sulfatase BDS1-like metallo-beta-lactamase superfamily hydrolase